MEGDKQRPFEVPTKQVKSVDDLLRWEKSEAYQVRNLKQNSKASYNKRTFRSISDLSK